MARMSPFRCPSCSAAIAMDDVNVAKDIALCRACGKTASFAALQSSGKLAEVDLASPPRHVRDAQDPQYDLSLIYHRKSPVLFFLVPFTLLWSGGSLGGIFIAPLMQVKPVENALFGIPFLIGTVVLLGVIAFLLAGGWRIRVSGNEGTAFCGIAFGWTRRFILDRTSQITLANCGASVNDKPVPCIRIDTGSTSCAFGAFIHEDSKHYIAARLRQLAQKR